MLHLLSSSRTLSKNAVEWKWNFGDGATSNEQNPLHTYSLPGNYTANLLVNNANGTASKPATINVLKEDSSGGDSSSDGSSSSDRSSSGGGGGGGGGGGSPEPTSNVESQGNSHRHSLQAERQSSISQGTRPMLFM